MKKVSVLGLALILVLAASTFASAANYVGGGLGIKAAAGEGAPKGIIGTLSLDFDVMEKLTLSANGYIEFTKKAEDDGGDAGERRLPFPNSTPLTSRAFTASTLSRALMR